MYQAALSVSKSLKYEALQWLHMYISITELVVVSFCSVNEQSRGDFRGMQVKLSHAIGKVLFLLTQWG